jgi:hypothetical protein
LPCLSQPCHLTGTETLLGAGASFMDSKLNLVATREAAAAPRPLTLISRTAVSLCALAVAINCACPALAVVEVTGGTWGRGDFNSDGSVDARDYVVWRKANSGSTLDFNQWRSVFSSTGTSVTAQPPADDPGWSNVSMGAVRNFVYLGNGWALSAWHVGPEASDTTSSLTLMFNGRTANIIQSQNFDVGNPNYISTGLSQYTDLRLVRLDTDLGLPAITIASTPLTTADLNQPKSLVTFIGQGPTREAALTNWDVSETGNNWSWTPNTTNGGNWHGYIADVEHTKRWGMNRVVDNVGPGSWYNFPAPPGEAPNSLRGKITLDEGGGGLRDVVSLFTVFDKFGVPYEAQAVSGDSGSAVFRKNGSQWELIGVINAAFTFPNQPFGGFYSDDGRGDVTTFADLTYYRQSILDIMAAHPGFSVAGDLNLDGVVDSKDADAFAQGWGYQQAAGSVTSWKMGDLNQDGRTDMADYTLMSSALNASGLSASAFALSNALTRSAVPEPAIFALLVAAVPCVFVRRRTRASRPH